MKCLLDTTAYMFAATTMVLVLGCSGNRVLVELCAESDVSCPDGTSVSSGSGWAPQTPTYPSTRTFRIFAVEMADVHDGEEAVALEIESAGMHVLEGPCNTTPAVCESKSCTVTLETTDLGICMTRVEAVTVRGDLLSRCYYEATFLGPERMESDEREVERALDRCQ